MNSKTVSWSTRLVWKRDEDGSYIADGLQASYRLNKDHFGNWQLWITRYGGWDTVNAGWREKSLNKAKDATLRTEKEFAREAIV